MADGNENIGGVNISIGGDYSQLPADLQAAQAVAESGGKAIADAVVKGAGEAQSIGKEIADSFAQIGPAAQSAAQSLDPLEASVAAVVASGANLAETIATAAAGLAAMEAPTASEAEQLNLFGSALDGIPWAEANGQLNLFTDEIENLVGTSAEGAIAIKQIAEAEQQAGQNAETASVSMGELVQQLVAIGAAVIIWNQLKAFGDAALEASDNVKQASISLTVLTGSADTAAAEIAKLQALGIQDGLSMPALLTAATRMQGLLGATAPVPALLSQLANAAAVSGQGIESAANAFDRMATSGSAAARQLQPLGLNLEDLAKAFNSVTGTSIATADNINEFFKQLSETQRVEVLSQALQKLSGIAQQAANETFGGQWNQLVAQWSQALQSAGDALKPVITDLIDFTKTDIAPTLKAMIDAFSQLPTPVKDFAVGIGFAAVAVIPLAAGLGTLGIALQGLAGLIPTVSGLFGGITIAAEGAAEAEVAAGAAATVAGAGLGALLIPTLALVAELGILVKSWLDFRSATEGAAVAQQDAITRAGDLSIKLQKLGVDTVAVNDAYNAGQLTLTEYVNKLNSMASAYTTANAAAIDTQKNTMLVNNAVKDLVTTSQVEAQAFQTAKGAYDAVVASLQSGLPLYKDHVATQQDLKDATDALAAAEAKLAVPLDSVKVAFASSAEAATKARDAYQTALGVFQATLTAYNAGTATYGQLAAAQDTLTKSEQGAAAAGEPIPGTIQAIDLAAQSAIQSMGKLASNQDIARDSAKAQADAYTLLQQSVIVAGQKLDLLVQEQQKVTEAAAAGRASQQQLTTVYQEVAAAATDLQAKQDELALSTIRQSNAAAAAQGVVGLLAQSVNEEALAVDQARIKMDQGTGSAAAYLAAEKALASAIDAVNQAQADATANVSRSTAEWALDASALAEAKVHLDDVTASYKGQLAAGKDVLAAQQAWLTAQIAVDQENAIAATGTKGLTDDVSLYTQALAAAKAKQDDITQAVASGTAKYSDLLTAEKATRSAQDDLTAAQKTANAASDSLTLSVDAQVKAWGALGDQGAQTAEQIAKASESIADSIADIEKAFSSATTAGPTVGGQASTANGTVSIGGFQGGNPFLGLAGFDSASAANAAYQAAVAAGVIDTFGNVIKKTTTGTSTATSTSSVSSGSTAAATTVINGPSDTAASGGTYPGVVIHQAAGEVLLVAAVENAAAAVSSLNQGGSSSTADSVATAAIGVSSTADSVASAASNISDVVGTLQYLTGAVASAADTVLQASQVVAQSKNVSSAVSIVSGGSTATASNGSNLPSVNVPSSTNVTGTPSIVSISQSQPLANSSPSLPQGGGAAGVQSQMFHVDLSGSTFNGTTRSDVESGVVDAMSRTLRDMGAKY